MSIIEPMRTITAKVWYVAILSVFAAPALAAVPADGQAASSINYPTPTARALPPALRSAFYGAFAKDAAQAYGIGKHGCAAVSQQVLRACFGEHGVRFSGAIKPMALRLLAYGRGAKLEAITAVKPFIGTNRVSYRHGGLTEWWRMLPVGFEQGFTVISRPAGHGKLTLALAANRKAERHGDALGWGKLRYGKLVVTDAKGKVIPAALQLAGSHIKIVVDDAHARYPLTVDPLVWIEQKVTASDGAAGDNLGWSVAISGKHAIVGAIHASVNGNPYQGAAYIFTKSNGVWSETQKLTADDGAANDRFGWSVAISGTTAVVGAQSATVNGNNEQGAAYVFTLSDGTWVQSAKLVAPDGAAYDQFGTSVTISGTTVLVGAYAATIKQNAYQGAVYVFNDTGGDWNEVQKLTASDGAAQDYFGSSVSTSGNTALVGAGQGGGDGPGAAYVFEYSGGTWSQITKLTADDGAPQDLFGHSVDLSGSVAVVGAPLADVGGTTDQGAAYVFSDSSGAWTQVQKLVVSDGGGRGGANFGWSVATSGSVVLAGAYFAEAAYEFTESGGTWEQVHKFTASDDARGDTFGPAVALSGSNVLIGALGVTVNGNSQQGAAYFYGVGDLGLAVSASDTVGQGRNYVSQTIATNNASAASPAVSATVTVPAAASFISATATQGSCSEDAGVVTCDFGQIPGNAGTATANVTLKATGGPGTTIENTASVAKATPVLTASAPTQISGGNCPAGYTEYDGQLNVGESFTTPPIEVEEAGQKYIQLDSPASFGIFAIVTSRYGQHTYHYPHKKQGHRWGAEGTYQIGVQANAVGGAYTLCTNLNPQQ